MIGSDWIEYDVNINGIDVKARYNENTIQEIFVPLLRRWTKIRSDAGCRILVMLAAPPGAGKSTLLSFLEKLSADCGGRYNLQVIGIDGFHRRQEYLLGHMTTRDGVQIPMVRIKGAPETFDLAALTDRVRRVREGECCGWPVYNRMLHNPEDNVIQVTGEIVVLEGNYLLLDEDGWRDLRQYADDTLMITAPEDLLRRRLVERRMGTGTDREASERFVDFSDMANASLVLEKSLPADLCLQIQEDGDYRLAGGSC